jgi:hypothetical protein
LTVSVLSIYTLFISKPKPGNRSGIAVTFAVSMEIEISMRVTVQLYAYGVAILNMSRVFGCVGLLNSQPQVRGAEGDLPVHSEYQSDERRRVTLKSSSSLAHVGHRYRSRYI